MSTIKALCDEGDLLGAIELLGEKIQEADKEAKIAYEADLRYLATKLPEAQWEAVEKAISFGWRFDVHYGPGHIDMVMGKKRMTIQEDGSYKRYSK